MEPGTYIVAHPTDTPVLADVPRDATATVRWARYVPSGWAGMDAALHLDVCFSDGRRVMQSVPLPPGAWLQAPNGAEVRRGAVLATLYGAGSSERSGLPGLMNLLEVAHPSPRAIVAERDGVVRFVPSPPHPRYRLLLRIDPDDGTRPVYRRVRKGSDVLIEDGEHVIVGSKLTGGSRDHRDLLRVLGPRRFADHLLDELPRALPRRSSALPRATPRLVVLEMVRYDRVIDPGESALAVRCIVPRAVVGAENAAALTRGARPARSRPVLLGVRGPWRSRSREPRADTAYVTRARGGGAGA